MSTAGEAKARGHLREQGEAKERSSRLRARVAADPETPRGRAHCAEAARPRAIECGRRRGASTEKKRTEAAKVSAPTTAAAALRKFRR
jgi:hypothetical protein